jgi:2'-5' RNA ligase
MGNLVIVAIPDESDRVWKVSSEKVPHLTLLFLGDESNVSNLESIVQFVEHAANTTLKRFYLPVDHRGELGADKADVLFFKKGRYDFKAVRDFRSLLLKDDNIKTAHDATAQFETPENVGSPGQPWIPHLTLGYPTSPAKEVPDNQDYPFYDVSFNRIAVWPSEGLLGRLRRSGYPHGRRHERHRARRSEGYALGCSQRSERS